MKDVSSQPEPFAGLGVAHGEVVLARAGKIEALGNQMLDHAGSVFDLTIRDTIQQPVMDFLPRITAPDILNDRRDIASAIRVLRVGPSKFLVQTIAKRVICAPRIGRCDVERMACVQHYPRHEEVQFNPIPMGMAHPQNVALVRPQSGESERFEFISNALLLILVGLVIAFESHHARGVAPSMLTTIDQLPCSLRIARQDFWLRIAPGHHRSTGRIAYDVTVLVTAENFAGDEISNGCCPAAATVFEEADHHACTPSLATTWRSLTI